MRPSGIFSPLQMSQPTEAEGYMAVARELLQGVEALSGLSNIQPRAAALLAAQTLECALHAFLSHKEASASGDSKIWHDLMALWKLAYDNGLGVLAAPPDWVRILSVGHNRPFYFRYQQGEKKLIVNGGETPALVPMALELKKIVETVGRATR